MNDARYCMGDSTQKEDRRLRHRQNNAVFDQNLCQNGLLQYAEHNIMNHEALQKICTSKEFYADYAKSYSYPA